MKMDLIYVISFWLRFLQDMGWQKAFLTCFDIKGIQLFFSSSAPEVEALELAREEMCPKASSANTNIPDKPFHE